MNGTGNFQTAIKQCEKALTIDPNNNFAKGTLAYAYLVTGDTLKWYETGKKIWNVEKYLASLDTTFKEQGYLGLIKARIRVNEEIYSQGDIISPLLQARLYATLGDYDKAMNYYEKAYEERWGLLAYVGLEIIDWPELKDNPRYIALLEKMNLPHPKDRGKGW